MAFDLPAAVNALVAQVDEAAEDQHEKALLLQAGYLMLQQKWSEAQNVATERAATLVLEARAIASGTTVQALKDLAAARMKKRIGEAVTAMEVLEIAASTFEAGAVDAVAAPKVP